jgi:hypothetical protein
MTFRLVRLVRLPTGDQPKVKSGKAAPTTGADWDPYLEARELEPTGGLEPPAFSLPMKWSLSPEIGQTQSD